MARLAEVSQACDQLAALLPQVQSSLLTAELQKIAANLGAERKALEAQAAAAEAKTKAAESAAADKKPAAAVRRLDFKSYSWEQTPKTLKFRATYPKGWVPKEGDERQFSDEDNVRVEFHTEQGVLRLLVENLAKPIVPERMTFKFKSDYVLVSCPKQTEGTWIELKQKDLGLGKESSSDDPAQGLRDMMKNLYNDGDDEMKKTIAKAMLESQQKPGF